VQAFIQHMGVVAPILVDNVDTDQVIPSREMNRVSKSGLGEGLFAGWRYEYDGTQKIGLNADFVLNNPAYFGASIVIAGKNFGCGSSREHAVWALRDYGIRAIVAESFGRIFRNNCARNGLLAIELSAADIGSLHEQTVVSPQSSRILIDLVEQSVHAPRGQSFYFEIAESDRTMLLSGLDGIEYTLQFEGDIDEFRVRDAVARRWAYLEDLA